MTFLETDCEKTEYILTDKFNTYGVCFLVLLAFNFSFNKYSKDTIDSDKEYIYNHRLNFYPKVFSNQYNSIILLDVMKNIIFIESNFFPHAKFCVFFEKLIEGYLDSIITMFGNKKIKFIDSKNFNTFNNNKNTYINNLYSRYFSIFILEYLKLKAEDRNEKQLIQFSSLFEVIINSS
jgi:hypothetical protein